jgi:hypothetical protein
MGVLRRTAGVKNLQSLPFDGVHGAAQPADPPVFSQSLPASQAALSSCG